MKMIERSVVLALILVVMISMLTQSCIIVRDDDDDDDPLEKIRYINNTPYKVDNYIDDRYRGSVEPWSTYNVYGDFEGTHKYFSEAVESTWEWGPSYFSLRDGQSFDIYLDPPA